MFLPLGTYTPVRWWGHVSGYSAFYLVDICVCVMGVDIGGPPLSTQVSVSWEGVSLLGVSVPPGIHVSLPGCWPQLAGPGQQGAQPLGP